MNKLELNPTIQEIINIKYVEVLMIILNMLIKMKKEI